MVKSVGRKIGWGKLHSRRKWWKAHCRELVKYVRVRKTEKMDSNRIKLQRWEAKSKKAQTCGAKPAHKI